MGKKKDKKEKKIKGAEKTLMKTEKNFDRKTRKRLQEKGEVCNNFTSRPTSVLNLVPVMCLLCLQDINATGWWYYVVTDTFVYSIAFCNFYNKFDRKVPYTGNFIL